MQIVSLQGDFYPYEDSQNAVLNGDADILEGDWIVDTATIDIPLNGEIYQIDVPLNGFKMPKMKMRMRVNTKGLSKSMSNMGRGLSKSVSAVGGSFGSW